MTKPLYSTNDPKGWCGDPKRGAALGRHSCHTERTFTGRVYLNRVRLNADGYDKNGTYFGHGGPLYWAASSGGEIDFMLRADTRLDARKQVLAEYPEAKVNR